MNTAAFTPIFIATTAREEGDILVVTTSRQSDGSVFISEGVFTDERDARRYCRGEVRWESCQRVQCPALSIDERGDFANVL